MNSNIGSNKLKGKSAGNIDDKTLQKLEESKKSDEKPEKNEVKKTLNLHPGVERLVSFIYVKDFLFLFNEIFKGCRDFDFNGFCFRSIYLRRN